jgi:peptidoglycan/xylan/chitin deacetylase (PgdA/CDA1 family)
LPGHVADSRGVASSIAAFAIPGSHGEHRTARVSVRATTLARRTISLLDPLLGDLALMAQRHRKEGVIALYHRVAPEPNLLYQTLHPDEFNKHCDLLKRSFSVIPLSELLERHRGGRSLARCCSIAFDDGYLDFRDHAVPILEAHGLPAALFVITDCLETGQAPWNLRLRRVSLGSPGLEATYETLFGSLNGMHPRERETWLGERESELGPTSRLYELPEMLTASDLPGIRSRGVEIGSHTVTHCNLGETDARTARRELVDSKRRLRELGEEISVVSYPSGSFTGSTMNAARDAGYRAGLAVGTRGIGPRSDPMALPRFDVTDRPVGMMRMELAGTVWSLRRLRRRFGGGLRRSPARSSPPPP